ncbi:MAG TPA: HD domain-containing protein, partial [Candidatus Saccharimonas sp.]|nr:HD domain-containing protein [Candidatus Saccharimonas sp.]
MKTYSREVTALLKECEFLFQKYSEELRATTQPYYLRKAINHVPNYNYRPEDPLIRETLMEHVGSLPMLAAAFYPHINNVNVDLGQALTMLAIHDIGELITGDEIIFTKKASAKNSEREAALSLLHKTYHAIYDDIETQTSP